MIERVHTAPSPFKLRKKNTGSLIFFFHFTIPKQIRTDQRIELVISTCLYVKQTNEFVMRDKIPEIRDPLKITFLIFSFPPAFQWNKIATKTKNKTKKRLLSVKKLFFFFSSLSEAFWIWWLYVYDGTHTDNQLFDWKLEVFLFILAIWRKNEKLLLLLLLLLSFTRTHPHTHVSCLFDSNDPNLYLFSLFDWLFIWKMAKLFHLLNLSLIRFKRILFFPTRFFHYNFFFSHSFDWCVWKQTTKKRHIGV